MINISVQNLFNQTVQISLIQPINSKDAIFFPSYKNITINGRKQQKYNHILILEPYSFGKLGPIEFKPKEPKTYKQILCCE